MRMNELMQADIQYLSQQKPEQMQLILSGMAALMQDTEAKAEAMQSQNWFQRMVKTVTGKNKLMRDEIRQNHDKLNMYMAEAVAELYRLGQVDHSIIMSLGTQINEIYMQQTQLKQMLGAFAVKLNEKIESVDNFHMLTTEIDQGVYTDGLPISDICKILSQFDKRILEEPRKLDIIRRALAKQGIIREEPVALTDYFADVLSIPMAEAGQVYMELGTMRGSFIASLTMKVMESYHFLPDLARKMKSRKGLIDKVIRDENLDESVALSTEEIYDDFINSKIDVHNGLALPASASQSFDNTPVDIQDEPLYTGNINEISGEEMEENVDRYRNAAEQDNADAQYLLGECYYRGEGVKRNYAEAVRWYRKAVEQGHAEAQYKLGKCYFAGEGIGSSMKQGVEWYRKAAEQGHAEAQYQLAECYYEGAGVKRDHAEAAQWYRKAAEQGHADAQWKLGDCYY